MHFLDGMEPFRRVARAPASGSLAISGSRALRLGTAIGVNPIRKEERVIGMGRARLAGLRVIGCRSSYDLRHGWLEMTGHDLSDG